MGYELHIIRKKNWEDDEEPSVITIEEWRQYVDTDPELEWTNNTVGGKYGAAHCEWTAHPTEKRSNWRPWFAYFKGAVDAKYPDEHTVRKMLKIADKLNARVQGDDFEYYDEEMIAEVFSSQQSKKKIDTGVPKPWWRFW